MRRVGRSAAAAALLCLPSAALSEITQPEPGRFICQAPAGQEEHTDVSAFFGGNVMSAAIQIASAERDAQTTSSAGLAFIFPDGNVAAVLVIASDDDPRRMWVGLVHPGNDRIMHLGSLRRARTAQVTMRLNDKGVLHVRGGTLSAQVVVGRQQPSRRELVCSSGSFHIQLTRPPRD